MEHAYYPASAFQTPILALLQAAPNITLDFIIELFDITTEAYKSSHLNIDYSECSEMELVFPDGKRTTQITSDRLWKMYRGTHVAPHLLESVLMALEHYLYHSIPLVSEDSACSLCLRLLLKSHSAAITAVVTSMVVAYPNKLFSIACILLHTKEIFILDIYREISEYNASTLKGLNFGKQLYDNERIKSNALPFRSKKFESIILEYQINRGLLSEEEFQMRLKKLYQAIDEAFQPEESLKENERFALYRMDLRKMKLERTQTEDNLAVVTLLSDLPEDLIQSQQKLEEKGKNDNKYLQLYCWSRNRFNHEPEKYKKYSQYEDNPASALNDALSLLSDPSQLRVDNRYFIYVSAVLLIDFPSHLATDSFKVCEKTIIGHLKNVIDQRGIQSIGDGTDAAIAALPALFVDRANLALFDDPAILLLMLICGWGKHRDWAITVFRKKVWKIDPVLAQTLLTAFVLLKPGYDQSASKFRDVSPFAYFEANVALLTSVMAKQMPEPLPDFSQLSITALQSLNLLCPPVSDPQTQTILLKTGPLFWPNLFSGAQSSYRGNGFGDSEHEREYLDWLAEYLLCTSETEQSTIVSELKPYLSVANQLDALLTRIILCQDRLMNTQAFWRLWLELFETIERICSPFKGTHQFSRGETNKIVTTYLLAFPWWKKGVRDWHTLREKDAIFFDKAANKLGHHPGTLYAIARVLNTIGQDKFTDYGIKWLAEIIRSNSDLRDSTLENNTEYYMEEYAQRFILANRVEIKRRPEMRKNLLEVLSFLVDRGSTCGYMLRESIC